VKGRFNSLSTRGRSPQVAKRDDHNVNGNVEQQQQEAEHTENGEDPRREKAPYLRTYSEPAFRKVCESSDESPIGSWDALESGEWDKSELPIQDNQVNDTTGDEEGKTESTDTPDENTTDLDEEANPQQDGTQIPQSPAENSEEIEFVTKAREKQQRIEKSNMLREKIVLELLDTEQKYVNDLELLVKEVLIPLVDVLTRHEINGIFHNMEEIAALHDPFLKELETRISNWNVDTLIGDIFLEKTDFLWQYETYLKGYHPKRIKVLCQIPEFKKMKESFEKSQDGKKLEAYLILPVQRIPRYVLLLGDLCKCTNKTHKDYDLVKQAHQKIENMLRILNNNMDRKSICIRKSPLQRSTSVIVEGSKTNVQDSHVNNNH